MKVYLTGEMSRRQSLVNHVVDGEEKKAVKSKQKKTSCIKLDDSSDISALEDELTEVIKKKEERARRDRKKEKKESKLEQVE